MEEIDQEEKIVEKKMSFKNKMIWLALFGVLLGFVIKTEMAKKFTIGFEDYKIADPAQTYDINKLEKDLLKKKEVLEQQQIEAENSENTACQDGEGETCKP